MNFLTVLLHLVHFRRIYALQVLGLFSSLSKLVRSHLLHIVGHEDINIASKRKYYAYFYIISFNSTFFPNVLKTITARTAQTARTARPAKRCPLVDITMYAQGQQ